MASWAWRSLAAETIFMALVCCCVLLTLRIRRRMAMRAGMGASLSRPLRLARRLEDGRELGEGRLQLLGELALDVLLLRDRREEGAVAGGAPGWTCRGRRRTWRRPPSRGTARGRGGAGPPPPSSP